MLSDLYSRMKEVSDELNISYSEWAKKANIKPITLYMFRNNIAKGKEARYSTLENLANSIGRLPFLFIDKKLEKAVKLGDIFIEYHSELPKDYISKTLKKYREEKNFSKTELARLSEINPLIYYNLENNSKIPQIGRLGNLAQSLDLKMLYFPERKERKYKKETEKELYEQKLNDIKISNLYDPISKYLKKFKKIPSNMIDIRELNKAIEFAEEIGSELNLLKARKNIRSKYLKNKKNNSS
jgi:transcriptional regulator with XRE-family HTH domain